MTVSIANHTLRAFALILSLAAIFSLTCCHTAEGPDGVCDDIDLTSLSDYVLVINVGYGDSILISSGGRFYLIDTGAEEHSDDVSAALDRAGVSKLDAVFITHSHQDHMGGMGAVAGKYKVKRVFYPVYSVPNEKGENKIENRADKLDIPSTALRAGDCIEGDGIKFQILAPSAYCESDDNDNSLVIRVEIDGIVYLFAGDMQFYEEALLLASGADVGCDVLKIGNHGNMDATSAELLDACTPSVSVVSTSTKEKPSSASRRVRDAVLAYGEYFITEDAELGVLITNSGGAPSAEYVK